MIRMKRTYGLPARGDGRRILAGNRSKVTDPYERDLRKESLLCYNCGCQMPDHNMGNPDNITDETFEEAAKAAGQNAEDAEEEYVGTSAENSRSEKIDASLSVWELIAGPYRRIVSSR